MRAHEIFIHADLDQVWCLIVSIPDLCPLSYFCVRSFCEVLSFSSRFAIFSLGKKELVVLLKLSSYCLVAVSVLCFFLTVSCVGLLCLIETYSDHTHFVFSYMSMNTLNVLDAFNVFIRSVTFNCPTLHLGTNISFISCPMFF